MKVIFIRHAEPLYSKDSLTSKGFREAELLGKRAAKWPITQAYASCLGRAQDTALPTLKAHGITLSHRYPDPPEDIILPPDPKTCIVYPWLREFSVPVDPAMHPVDKQIGWDFTPDYLTTHPELYDRNQWWTSEIFAKPYKPSLLSGKASTKELQDEMEAAQKSEAHTSTSTTTDKSQAESKAVRSGDRNSEDVKNAGASAPKSSGIDPRFAKLYGPYYEVDPTIPRVRQEYDWVCTRLDEVLAQWGYVRDGLHYRTDGSHGSSCDFMKYNDTTVACEQAEVERRASAGEEEPVLVFFCHLGIMSMMISHLINAAPAVILHGFFIPPASVTVFSTEEHLPGQALFRCQMLGDTSHLREAGEPVSYYGAFEMPFEG